MSSKVKISLAGAGLIGRRHIEVMQGAVNDMELDSIVDPTEEGKAYAHSLGVKWFSSLKEMLNTAKPDGVILATPNQVHVENGLECIAAGCPILVEKPIATTFEEAQQLIEAAELANVPVLVGHHRRHNHLIQKARQIIKDGELGQLTTVHASCWFYKPEEYFAPEWRRKIGAGPILVNTIHDVDLLRYLCGDVESVQAIASNNVRKFETEDTAAVLIKFKSGALGTLSVTDAVQSPWSWEMTSGENPDFSATPESCYMIGGTKGSLSVPDIRLWKHESGGHWKSPISAKSFSKSNVDPLLSQINHFINVIKGSEEPLISAEEGMKSLCVVEAIQRSATSGEMVLLDEMLAKNKPLEKAV